MGVLVEAGGEYRAEPTEIHRSKRSQTQLPRYCAGFPRPEIIYPELQQQPFTDRRKAPIPAKTAKLPLNAQIPLK